MDLAKHTAALTALAVNPLDPASLLQAFGLAGVCAILFAETGLLVGFFFPGDSMLFLAGVAASPVAQQILGVRISLVGLLVGAPIFAVAGAQFGHFLGARYGRRLFERPDSRLFRREYVERAEHYFNKFGPGRAVVLARFIPIVRTFLNPVAGMLEMPARRFLVWNVVGAVLWTDGIILVGYVLSERVAAVVGNQIDKYILPVVALIVAVSLLPIVIEVLRERRRKHATPGPEAPAATPARGVARVEPEAGERRR